MDNSTQPDLANCYPAAEASPANEFRKQMVFWVEGVALLVVASFGIVGNVLTCAVLRRISLNNVFNQLIVVLASVDSVFAGLCVINYALKKAFGVITYTSPYFVHLWPVIVYPLHNITYSVSLFVTLAIAIERYYSNNWTSFNIYYAVLHIPF